MNYNFWKDKKVFVTGHTGFKGSWLSLWLQQCGSEVSGYSLDPPTKPSLFELADVASGMNSNIADIRNYEELQTAILKFDPEIIFHMAAQPLVRLSYEEPLETYSTNVMGTANLLNAARGCTNLKSILVITTDKCYQNNEWYWGYRETDRLGGYDPYSNSKACCELVVSSFRDSFFNERKYDEHGVAIASVRAGNVIGGGDWAADRIIPDAIKSFLKDENLLVRSPEAIRPWQHVLEPLRGYLTLAQELFENGIEKAGAYNFGPDESDAKPVSWIMDQLCDVWQGGASWYTESFEQPHETNYLKLDCTKSKTELGWLPTWNLDRALLEISNWYKSYRNNEDMRHVTLKQIESYQSESGC